MACAIRDRNSVLNNMDNIAQLEADSHINECQMKAPSTAFTPILHDEDNTCDRPEHVTSPKSRGAQENLIETTALLSPCIPLHKGEGDAPNQERHPLITTSPPPSEATHTSQVTYGITFKMTSPEEHLPPADPCMPSTSNVTPSVEFASGNTSNEPPEMGSPPETRALLNSPLSPTTSPNIAEQPDLSEAVKENLKCESKDSDSCIAPYTAPLGSPFGITKSVQLHSDTENIRDRNNAQPSSPMTISESIEITPSTQFDSPSDSSAQIVDSALEFAPINKKRPSNSNDLNQYPTPKRMTLAAQRKQHCRLSSPFRSPLLVKPNPKNTNSSVTSHLSANSSCFTPVQKPMSVHSCPVNTRAKNSSPATLLCNQKSAHDDIKSVLTSSTKASSQFKSPVISSTIASTPLRVNTSRTIQALERKLQVLKRAIKIRNDNDEEKLEHLVKKWRRVGHEVAWELWNIVRDEQGEEAGGAMYLETNSRYTGEQSFSKSWGWADNSENNSYGHSAQSNWGWDSSPRKGDTNDRNEDLDYDFPSPSKLESELVRSLSRKPAVPRTTMLPPTPRGAYYEQQCYIQDKDECCDTRDEYIDEQTPPTDTAYPKSLGTMLLRLGIRHETLGWSEDEGDFIED